MQGRTSSLEVTKNNSLLLSRVQKPSKLVKLWPQQLLCGPESYPMNCKLAELSQGAINKLAKKKKKILSLRNVLSILPSNTITPETLIQSGEIYLAIQKRRKRWSHRWFNQTFRSDRIQRSLCELSGSHDGSGSSGGKRGGAGIGNKGDRKAGRLTAERVDNGHVWVGVMECVVIVHP